MNSQENYAFSKVVNDFIESLKQHPDTIQIRTYGNETIIEYEDWSEHPPILNYRSPLHEIGSGNRNPRFGRQKGTKLSEETKHKISEARKNQIISESTRQKMSDSKKGDKNPMRKNKIN
jgi:hypothetical protein